MEGHGILHQTDNLDLPWLLRKVGLRVHSPCRSDEAPGTPAPFSLPNASLNSCHTHQNMGLHGTYHYVRVELHGGVDGLVETKLPYPRSKVLSMESSSDKFRLRLPSPGHVPRNTCCTW